MVTFWNWFLILCIEFGEMFELTNRQLRYLIHYEGRHNQTYTKKVFCSLENKGGNYSKKDEEYLINVKMEVDLIIQKNPNILKNLKWKI